MTNLIPPSLPAKEAAARRGVADMRVILTSWKEIAAYLGKGVRTAQRWEIELGLPVRRPNSNRSVVMAVRSEIDEWVQLQTSPRNGHQTEIDRLRARMMSLGAENDQLRQIQSFPLPQMDLSRIGRTLENNQTTVKLLHQLIQQSRELRRESRTARQSHAGAVEALHQQLIPVCQSTLHSPAAMAS